MTQNPITVRPETKIIEAYQLMVTTRIQCLPIVVGNLLVGIVTLSDLYQVKPFDMMRRGTDALPKAGTDDGRGSDGT